MLSACGVVRPGVLASVGVVSWSAAGLEAAAGRCAVAVGVLRPSSAASWAPSAPLSEGPTVSGLPAAAGCGDGLGGSHGDGDPSDRRSVPHNRSRQLELPGKVVCWQIFAMACAGLATV